MKRRVLLVFWGGFVLLEGFFFLVGIFVYSFVLVILCLMFRSMLRMDFGFMYISVRRVIFWMIFIVWFLIVKFIIWVRRRWIGLISFGMFVLIGLGIMGVM